MSFIGEIRVEDDQADPADLQSKTRCSGNRRGAWLRSVGLAYIGAQSWFTAARNPAVESPLA